MGDSVIWTDNENTRSLIWQSYIGFSDNWEKYIMYKKTYGVDNKVYQGGIYRYATSFFEEIRPFLTKISVDNQKVVETIIEENLLFDNDKNLLLVRRFLSDFMYKSGIKNILFEKDNRSGIDKVSDKYKL